MLVTEIKQSVGESAPAPDKPNSATGVGCKIWIGNLRPHTDEFKVKDLAEEFTRFGDIVSIIHKGNYAFIDYAEPISAEKAVHGMCRNNFLQVHLGNKPNFVPNEPSK